jgi:hypothetical protein
MNARSRQRLLSGWLICVSLACSFGCALVPGVPAGPLGGRGIRAGVTYAYAYAPASAETTTPSGAPYTLRGNSEMFRGALPSFVPLRAMVRANPTSFLDVGADIGWMDAGLQLRAGPLDRHSRLPWGIELEWRTGQTTYFDDPLARRARAYRARLELYPALGTFGYLDAFGVLTLGVSTGTRLHYVWGVPAAFDTAQEGPFPAGLLVSRDETRLEASLGAHGSGKMLAVTVALQPWLGLHQGAVRGATCDTCSLEFQSLDVDWGLGLVAGGSLVWQKD